MRHCNSLPGTVGTALYRVQGALGERSQTKGFVGWPCAEPGLRHLCGLLQFKVFSDAVVLFKVKFVGRFWLTPERCCLGYLKSSNKRGSSNPKTPSFEKPQSSCTGCRSHISWGLLVMVLTKQTYSFSLDCGEPWHCCKEEAEET